jgi:hypothetical protein
MILKTDPKEKFGRFKKMSLDNQLCFYSESYKSLNINEYEKWIKSNKEKINIRTQKLKELMRTVLTVLINEIDTLDGDVLQKK